MPLSPEIQICVDAGVIRIEQVALLGYWELNALKIESIRNLFLDGKITFEQLNLGCDQRHALESESIRNLFLDGKITFEQLNIGYNQRDALEIESIRNFFLDGKITFEQLNLGYNQRDALEIESIRNLFLDGKITFEQLNLGYNQRESLKIESIRNLFLDGKITFEQLNLEFYQREALKSESIRNLFLDGKITLEQLDLGYYQCQALNDKSVYKLIADNVITIDQIPERPGILYDLKLTIKKLNAAANHYVSEHQSLLKTMPSDISLLHVYFYAMIEFRLFLSGSSDALGISNGFFSLSRHKIKEADLFDKLSDQVGFNAAAQYCANVIKINGSLYDPRLGENHSFTNFFLASLYQHNVTAYRKVVGTAYGIVFLDGSAVTLYRRDTRHYRHIFNVGFELQSCNMANTRKYLYSEPWTFSYGISTAKMIPPSCYGWGGYFTITFPNAHRFLLVDIVETCRLRGKLHERNNVINVQEVNCMQRIPASNITFFTLEKVNPHQVIKNNNAVTPSVESNKKIQYGVY